MQSGILTIGQVETYVAVVSVVLTAVILLLRWHKTEEPGDMES